VRTWLNFVGIGVMGGLCLCGFTAQATLEIGASVQIHARSDFEAPLAAQGSWVQLRSYGRCWHPVRVALDWRPSVTASRSGRIAVGTGRATSRGLGRVTIMAGGHGIRSLAGFGFLISNGRPRGSTGVAAEAISDGPRVRRLVSRSSRDSLRSFKSADSTNAYGPAP